MKAIRLMFTNWFNLNFIVQIFFVLIIASCSSQTGVEESSDSLASLLPKEILNFIYGVSFGLLIIITNIILLIFVRKLTDTKNALFYYLGTVSIIASILGSITSILFLELYFMMTAQIPAVLLLITGGALVYKSE